MLVSSWRHITPVRPWGAGVLVLPALEGSLNRSWDLVHRL